METMSSSLVHKKVVLITGASGVLGRLLVAELSALGHKVYALSSRKEELRSVFADDECVQCIEWEDLFSGCVATGEVDTVFHCAFARSQRASDLARSVELAGKLFTWCAESGVKGVVNVSSQSIYGGYREVPSCEDGPVAPLDAYAAAKLTCEFLGDYAIKGTSLDITHVRLASLIGPQFEERLVNKMIRAARLNGALTVVGGTQQFSFLDVRDAVSGLIAMLDTDPSSWQKVYNLGTEERCSLLQIAESIAALVESRTGHAVNIERKEADIRMKIALDCSRFQKDFGWQSGTDFVQSLEYILEHQKEFPV